MNAPNPSSDRDFDSLRRAQRAHEPSMEEILASIRSIIADDREPAAPPAARPSASAGPQIVYSNDSAPPARAAAAAAVAAAIAPQAEAEPVPPPAREPVASAPEPVAEAAAPAPKVVWEKPTLEQQPAAPPPPADEEEGPFASPETDAAVAASLNALSATVALQSAETIERLAREMLRPMLKAWLDDHLPSLVERLVRAEIQRVARGGR